MGHSRSKGQSSLTVDKILSGSIHLVQPISVQTAKRNKNEANPLMVIKKVFVITVYSKLSKNALPQQPSSRKDE